MIIFETDAPESVLAERAAVVLGRPVEIWPVRIGPGVRRHWYGFGLDHNDLLLEVNKLRVELGGAGGLGHRVYITMTPGAGAQVKPA